MGSCPALPAHVQTHAFTSYLQLFFFFFLFPSKLACFFLLLIYPSLPRSSVFSLSISITVLGVCEALPGHQPQNAIRSHHTTSLCSRKHFLVHSFPPHTAIPNHYIKPSPRAEHQQVSGSSPNNSPLMSSLLIRFYLSICHLDVTFPSSLATQVSLLPSNSLCISSCPLSKCCLTAAVQTLFLFLLSHNRHALGFMHFTYKFTSPCPFSVTCS